MCHRLLSLAFGFLSIIITANGRLHTSLTLESLRFAKERCQEEHAGDNLTQRALWSAHLYANDHNTHCYIKCLLLKVGLINLHTRALDFEVLQEIWSFDMVKPDGQAFINSCLSKLSVELDGLCVSYYHEFHKFRAHCDFFFGALFLRKTVEHEHKNKNGAAYKHVYGFQAQLSKELGVSASTFCTAKHSSRRTRQTKSCRLECIYRYFHYFDAYGRLDESAIWRSFREAHVAGKKNAEVVRFCTHNANALFNAQSNSLCKMARRLYICLDNRTWDYQHVREQRNKRSVTY